jgi:hypothetical protein
MLFKYWARPEIQKVTVEKPRLTKAYSGYFSGRNSDADLSGWWPSQWVQDFTFFKCRTSSDTHWVTILFNLFYKFSQMPRQQVAGTTWLTFLPQRRPLLLMTTGSYALKHIDLTKGPISHSIFAISVVLQMLHTWVKVSKYFSAIVYWSPILNCTVGEGLVSKHFTVGLHLLYWFDLTCGTLFLQMCISSSILVSARQIKSDFWKVLR